MSCVMAFRGVTCRRTCRLRASAMIIGGCCPTAVIWSGSTIIWLVCLCPWIETVVVDGGYKTLFINVVQAAANRVVEVVKRPDFAKGFVLLPKRWKVEQTI